MVKWEEEFRNLLTQDLASIRAKNSKFSVRAYAKKIGLSPGSLSEVLQNKREWRISKKRALEILSRITVEPKSKNRLLIIMGETSSFPTESVNKNNFEILTDWSYYPILFSYQLPFPHNQPQNIARRLGISHEKVVAVTEDLLARNFLVRTEENHFKKTEVNLTAGDGPSDEVIRTHHALSLKLSERALAEIPHSERDFTSLTFTGSENAMLAVKSEIRKFHQKIAAIMDGDQSNTHVFRLAVQLFPMEFKSHD